MLFSLELMEKILITQIEVSIRSHQMQNSVIFNQFRYQHILKIPYFSCFFDTCVRSKFFNLFDYYAKVEKL